MIGTKALHCICLILEAPINSQPHNGVRSNQVHIYIFFQEENIDLEELEQFAKSFKRRRIELGMYTQGSHRLEKYLNIQNYA